MMECKCCSNVVEVDSQSEGTVCVTVKFKVDALFVAMVDRAFKNGETLVRSVTLTQKQFDELVSCWTRS